MTAFDDLLAANAAYAAQFTGGSLTAPAARELAVLTCMDSRIDPLRALGLQIGDFKMLRNAGGRLTADMQQDLVLASHLLNVRRVLIMPHTKCAMTSAGNADITARILADSGLDAGERDWQTIPDQLGRLKTDVETLRADPLLFPGTVVSGAIYDVETGTIEIVFP